MSRECSCVFVVCARVVVDGGVPFVCERKGVFVLRLRLLRFVPCLLVME